MDIEIAYNLRKNIYDNKDLFYNLNNKLIDNNIDLDKYEHINNAIIEGKEILSDELVKQNLYNIEKKGLLSIENDVKNVAIDIQNKLEHIKTLLQIDNLQDHVDSITYSFSCIQDSFKDVLNEKINKIDKKLIISEQILHKLSQSYGILKNITPGYACPICINKQVNVYVSKCGHTFCNECISKTNYCYICRSKIEKINKLYFS
jgi:hypothetical protein